VEVVHHAHFDKFPLPIVILLRLYYRDLIEYNLKLLQLTAFSVQIYRINSKSRETFTLWPKTTDLSEQSYFTVPTRLVCTRPQKSDGYHSVNEMKLAKSQMTKNWYVSVEDLAIVTIWLFLPDRVCAKEITITDFYSSNFFDVKINLEAQTLIECQVNLFIPKSIKLESLFSFSNCLSWADPQKIENDFFQIKYWETICIFIDFIEFSWCSLWKKLVLVFFG
jgi:hypothetical protein